MTFNVGDRIRIYGMAWSLTGDKPSFVGDTCVVERKTTWGTMAMLEVRNPLSKRMWAVNPKQCRRLKKRT